MAKRTKRKRKRSSPTTMSSLADMSVDEFMASGFEDEESSKVTSTLSPPVVTKRKSKKSEGSSHLAALSQLAETDPDFYQFLQDTDQQLLKFGDSGEEGGESEGVASGTSDDEDVCMSVPEPKPPHVTNRRERSPPSNDESGNASDMDGDGQQGGRDDVEEGRDQEEVGEDMGLTVTQGMVQKWVESVKETHSLKALRQLSLALHSAIEAILHKDTPKTYRLESAHVFNNVVVSCLKFAHPCFEAHLPTSKRTDVTSLKAWSKVKRVLKPYLTDLVSLMSNLQDPTMQCAVIRHVRTMARYIVCLPKLCRAVNRQLVLCWSTGDHHVQVMAFLGLRELTLLKPHPSLHIILKKMYMAFVRNCKFTTNQTLPKIRFMQNCLVELLSVDPHTTYQHGFVYIRQLAIHLRAAITSGKKDAQQAVYNWQFVHCLDLWALVMGRVSDVSLRPLLYPLVQVVLGTINLQPSSKYFPARLHLVKTLVELAQETDSFIPSAPYLVEVMESHGTNVSGRLQTGKPPELSLLLRATKPHLQSRAYQSAVLNESFELLLQFAATHSHFIGFPELMFPITARLRKVAKVTPYSWLKLQLQQLISKVDDVAKQIEKEREKVDFSPNQTEKIAAWEQARKGMETSISKFLATWVKVHSTKAETTDAKTNPKADKAVGMAKKRPNPPTEEGDVAGNSEDDIVEDFDLSSADSD